MFGQGKVGGRSSTVFNLPSYTFPLFLALMHSHVAFTQKFPFAAFFLFGTKIFLFRFCGLCSSAKRRKIQEANVFLFLWVFFCAGSFGLLFVLWFCGWRWRSVLSFSPVFPLFLLFCSVNLNCIYSNFVDKACGLKRMQWLSRELLSRGKSASFAGGYHKKKPSKVWKFLL